MLTNLTGAILMPDGLYLLAGGSNSNASEDKSEDSKGGFDYWIVELEPDADQVCAGDVTLSSQAEVDAFKCTELIR